MRYNNEKIISLIEHKTIKFLKEAYKPLTKMNTITNSLKIPNKEQKDRERTHRKM